jgi:hypothetical protein
LSNLDILTAKEIAEATCIEYEVVRRQLSRKLKLGWVMQPCWGQYRLTSLCGSPTRRKPKPAPVEPPERIYTLSDLSELLWERECLDWQLHHLMSMNGDLSDYKKACGHLERGDHFWATDPTIHSLIAISDALDSLGWTEPEAPPDLQDLAIDYFLAAEQEE